MKQLSFLPEEMPEGFSYLPDFISSIEELQLMSFFQTLKWEDIHMHGVIAKRKVVHYGYGYEYDSRSLTPGSPIPSELNFLLPRVAKALDVRQADIGEVLVTYYPEGSQIGWHRDAPMFESLLGISLDAACLLKLKEGQDKFQHELEPRSAYTLQGIARWEWQHHIPPVKSPRYSVTLRTLKK
ncbi:MAG TPA: alpha-ketoglutarate-dependent dioxygenase AlkB [Bacteriovoracaceae bacterium]|nr:alpha-ketoglutarate-dependent dioxygenase AlkB [Bacteriovoracaceae bacterium]